MASLVIVVGAVIFLIASGTYAKRIEKAWGIDGDRPTPAHTLEDGVDYLKSLEIMANSDWLLHVDGIFSEFKKTEYYDQDDTYQVSVYIPDILNEWRIFVLGGEVLDCKCYFSDDPFDIKAPSSDRVREIIKQINLPAFTLDIATSHYRKDIIIEVHDFFSCGLYGFADYNKLPYMFYRSHAHKFL